MRLDVNLISDYAEQCDRCLNHDYKRVRVEDQMGLQRVNWDFYKSLEEIGGAMLVTAIDGQALVGFDLYTTFVHPHHPNSKLGLCSFLIVHPNYRGQKLGSRMIEFAMPQLKKRGCTHIMHNRRMVYDVAPLFPKLGFEKIEETYVKELK